MSEEVDLINFVGIDTGRQGLAITGGINIRGVVVIDGSARTAFDLEPNAEGDTVADLDLVLVGGRRGLNFLSAVSTQSIYNVALDIWCVGSKQFNMQYGGGAAAHDGLTIRSFAGTPPKRAGTALVINTANVDITPDLEHSVIER